jgi:hypothetical protein
LDQQEHENQRKAEIFAKFIVEQIEPLLEKQIVSCLPKTVYIFIPVGTEQGKLKQMIPENAIIVEGFGGSNTASTYISRYWSKEYVKIIRLIDLDYNLDFWQQQGIVHELKQDLKARRQANGEKLAETIPNSAGRPWRYRSFMNGETLSPGYIGVRELLFGDLVIYDEISTFIFCLPELYKVYDFSWKLPENKANKQKHFFEEMIGKNRISCVLERWLKYII